jgi:hypothetical protein
MLKDRKNIIIFASVILIFSLHSFGQTFLSTGSGNSEDDAYFIATYQDLNDLATYVNGGNSCAGKFFQVTQDITFPSVNNFTPIGTSTTSFQGTFNGNHHTISNLLISGGSQGSNKGLFGVTNNAVIKNIIANCSIDCTNNNNYTQIGIITGYMKGGLIDNCIVRNCTIKGKSYIGGLTGQIDGGTITNCAVQGCEITATGSNIGGLIGIIQTASATIENCSADTQITGSGATKQMGGLIGNTSFSTIIRNSCSKGDIICESKNEINIGGFIGQLKANIEVYNCYSSVDIVSTNSDGAYQIGNFIGYQSSGTSNFLNCYAAGTISKAKKLSDDNKSKYSGFAFVANETLTATNCFYNNDWKKGSISSWNNWIETNGINTFNNVIGKTITDMKEGSFLDTLNINTSDSDNGGNQANPYVTDSNNPWVYPAIVPVNEGLPVMWWEITEGVLPQKVIIGLNDSVSLYGRTSPLVIPSDYVGLTPDTIVLVNDAVLIDSSASNDYFLLNLGGTYKLTSDGSPKEYLQTAIIEGADKWTFIGSPTGKTTLVYFSYDSIALGNIDSITFENPDYSFPACALVAQNEEGIAQKLGVFQWEYTPSGNDWTHTGYKNDTLKQGEGVFAINMTNTTSWENNTNAQIFWHKTRTIEESSICNSDFSFQITNNFYSSPQTGGHWFALSNPYTFPINASNFVATNNSKIQGEGIYLWSSGLGNGGDWYFSQNYNIAPMQGFMIAASTDNPTSLSFSKTMDNVTDKASKADYIISLDATANGISRTASITINNNASNNFDLHDAYALFGQNILSVEPYFIADNRNVMLNVIKSIPYSCPLNLHSASLNDITLTFNNIPDDIVVILFDLKDNNIDTLTNNKSISKTINSGENTERFILSFSKFVGLESVDSDDDLQILTCNNQIIVTGIELQHLEIFNTIGQSVYYTKMNGNYSCTDINELPKGTYLVKATSKNKIKTIKFIITKQ